MPSTYRVRFSLQNVSIVISALFFLLFLSTHTSGQTSQTTTDKMTPSGITPGAPAGSYPLTGMESINLYNGNLDFHLPLLALDGRGSAVRNMTLSLNTKKWRVRESHTETSDTYTPTTVNWGSVDVGYLAGKLQGRQSGWSSRTCTNPPQTRYYYTNTKLTFVTPDGTEYDLRDQLTDGQPMIANQCGGIQGASRGTLFKTSDGSGVTFISDSTIFDKTSIPTGQAGSWNLIVSGYLLLPDGTRYRIDSGGVSWIRDRNGNLVYSQTDAINRQITITTLPDGSDQITYRGYQGAQRTITITHTLLGSALRAGFSLQTHAQLFPELLGGYNLGTYNPTVVSAVILPDGRSYQFLYNSYGELARVVLPTGGAIEYDMTAGSGVVQGSGAYGLEYQIYRRVIERRTYADGTTLEGRTVYSADSGITGVSHYNSAGTKLAVESHSYYGDPAASLFTPVEGGFYSDWHEGREYSTTYFTADGATVLKTVTNTWEQRAAVSWYPSQYYNAGNEPANDPRISQTVTTLVDTNQVSKTTYSYDQFNNQTDSYEYDYGTGAAGALVRHIHTDYVTTNPVNGTDYTATGVYLRSLPSQTSVFDAGGVERSRTTLEYDNYAADSNHSPLTDRVNISGHDSGFTTAYATRGNLTAITHYLLTNGAVTGSVRAYSQFDIAGNLTKTIDARGYATTIDYADRFGAPDGEARSNTPPSELTGLSSFAFATKLTNALGQTVYGQYDYYLGRPVDGEDLNGIVASAYYNDALDRPTQVRRAVTTPAASQSTFSYDDPNHTITVTSDLNTNNDNALVTKTLYDGLGRTTESRQYEGGTNYIAVQTQYDGLGRAYKTSNPFRPWQSETAQWTTSGFDGMGRVVSLTTPDNGVVATSYSGNSVTVTDQAGKARKSVTDALGRLSQVYEDPSGLNYQTTYAYDVLDNLTTVTQGTQTRSFVYDSLKRLTSATNPESGTITYQYDNNSNLIQKTDARSIVSTYAYDALSRNTTIDYSDTSSINPDVTRVYDGAMNGKGRLWVSYAGGDLSNGSNVEQVAIDNYDALGRPTVQRQLFKVNGTWGTTYQISSVYNLAGAVTSQTYPSGHTVSYSYDSAGRTNSFSGNLGDATTRTYATGITYDPSGGVRQEQFGTQIPLYHKKHYNRRGQLFDIRVSTVSWDTDQWNWNRGALVNYYSSNYAWEGDPSTPAGPDNNGNVLLQQHWVPTDDAISSFYHTQDFYTYDSLNRIQSAAEFHASLAGQSAQDFAQMFAYDRWGNRTINPASWGVGINTKQFTVDANTNRLGVPAGQSGVMSYDVAGNLSTDSYTGFGSRVYNAENKMTAAQDNSGVWAYYTYNADGQRTRRKINNQETWQVYGFSGELLAEYSANAPAASPQKEYGYRSGQLLVTLDAPPANGYAYRRAITIDHTKIPNTDQTDFPVLISGTYSYLATTANGGNVQNANGYDVIFTSDTGCATKLNHEVETYTAANGAVNYWVKVPAVSHTSDTVIYMCYGNSLITTDQSNRTGVWDTNYKGVWHLSDNAASTAVTDSTGANNGTNQANTSSKTATGKVGKALTYNGSSDYTDMGTNVGGYVLSDSFTVEAWVNAALDSANRAVYGNAYALAGYLLRVNTANKVRFVVVTNGSNFNGRDSSTLSSGWHHVVAVYGGSGTPSVYIDGVLDNAATVSGGTVTTITTAAHTRIGAAPESGYESYFNGTIDEVRTSKIARSADWIKTEYNNQNSPSTFYSVSSATSLTLPSQVSWLVTDQLGTPRMIIDQTGSLANVKRHDYLPFGEELFAPTGGRTATLGYSGSDNLHQQFTSKERDNETGLDYFGTRYHSSIQGRFTSVDPANYQARLNPTDPQSWNAYSYVNNHPLVLVDRDGKGIGSFFEKLKNLFLWNMWATNEDVQKEEDKQRQYLLQHADAYGGVIIMSPVTGLYMRVYPREMNRANVFLWSDAAHYWEENGGGYRQLTPQEMASVIDAGGTLYRGGSNITVREKIDVNIKDGMVQTNKGPSLNMDPEKIKQFGGAYRVESMPDELQVIQRGQDPGHYEIVPKSPMPLERFIELLQKVVLKPE